MGEACFAVIPLSFGFGFGVGRGMGSSESSSSAETGRRNLLRRGSTWLSSQRRRHMTDSVDYFRGADSVNVPATVGRTTFEHAQDVDGSEVRTRRQMRDYLITAADLVIDETALEPQINDEIRETDADGTVHVYEVQALGKSDCWEWSDQHRTTYRIHTVYVGVA